MRRFIIMGALAVSVAATFATSTHAQFQYQNNSPFGPNSYNRQSQPLSPYLNMLRGGNTAVNYFYGVRPGTMTGGGNQSFGGYGGLGRQTFFPQIDTLYDLENTNPADGLRPTGHPFGFNNTLGFFGAGMNMGSTGQRNQNSMQSNQRKSTTPGR